MASFIGESFVDQEIILDGNSYKDCSFERCIISYEGGTLPFLDGNKFTECEWMFAGAAARTMTFMKALYGGGGKDLINETIKAITSEEKENGQGSGG